MDTKPSSLRRLGTIALANGLLWAGLATYSLHGSLPYNTVKLPFEKAVDSTAWAPQGWAFFTGNPREDQMRIFVDGAEGWRPAGHPNADPANWFGASRAQRALSNEAGTLIQSLVDSSWKPCTGNPQSCMSDGVAIKVKNPLPEPTLCGQVAITLQAPVPWAWASSSHKTDMPVRVARLEVKC